MITVCKNTTEIWDYLKTFHEGTIQAKKSKVDMLTTQYEAFTMKKGETIQEITPKVHLNHQWTSFLG